MHTCKGEKRMSVLQGRKFMRCDAWKQCKCKEFGIQGHENRLLLT